jgi:4-hydroxybenzoate polyprenyltransferase
MSWTEGREYLGERILKVRIVLLVLMLLTGVVVTRADAMANLHWLLLATCLFVLAFRLWDDLADLEFDRLHHPDRCLVRSADLRPFYAAQWLLLASLAGFLMIFPQGGRILPFLGLVAAFLAIYRVTASRPRLRSMRTVLVLVKYPAFVFLLAHRPDEPATLLTALVVYLLPLLDELRSTGPGMLVPAALLVGLTFLAWLGLST